MNGSRDECDIVMAYKVMAAVCAHVWTPCAEACAEACACVRVSSPVLRCANLNLDTGRSLRPDRVPVTQLVCYYNEAQLTCY